MPNVASVDSPLDLFGGLVTDLAAPDLPDGVSQDCQDVAFIPGAVKTRPGLQNVFATIGGNPTINYLKTLQLPNLTEYLLALDSSGTLWQSTTVGSGLSSAGSVQAGTFAKSCTLFNAEYLGLSDGKFGLDIPRQLVPGSYFDRVTQVGPGGPPTAADSATAGSIVAGVHGIAVMFILRTGAITKPSPTGSWTAAGSKKVSVTAIPTGAPNVIGRILCFTASGGATYFYLSSFIISDNVTTSITVDFSDTALAAGTAVAPLFNNVEIGEVAGFLGYSNRLVTWGERNKVPNFVNLPFDGGYNPGAGGTGPTNTSAGPNSPSAAADVSAAGDPWSNVNNVFALDGAFASCVLGSPNSNSDYINATGYGFNSGPIPSNATIQGIVVTAYVKASALNAVSDFAVFLLKNGVIVGANRANGNLWTTAVAGQVYGNSLDLWGTTWTPSDINNVNFGIAYSAQFQGGVTPTAFVDYISITVYYSTPGTPGTSPAPYGWTAGAAVAGGNSAIAAAQAPYYGDAYAITGDGATAKRGEINQAAYQDYLGVPIIVQNVTYKVRARIKRNNTLAQGTLHINLKSTSQSFTTAGLSVSAAQATTSYVEYTAFLTDVALVNPPSDLLLQLYADGTPTNNGVFVVDNIEVYDASRPYLTNQVRISRFQTPEAFDSITGFFSRGALPVRSAFVLTDRSELVANDHLHIITTDSIYRTQDNGNEPGATNGWPITTVTEKIGTPSINGVDVGEDWVAIGHSTGMYLYYFGSEPEKISQEIQPIVDRINPQFAYTMWVRVDVKNKRILWGVPLDANTSPNVVLVLDYRGLISASQIIETPPIHFSAYSGKMITLGLGRKWTIWNITANSAWFEPPASPLQIPSANSGGMFLGNGTGNGKIYTLQDSQLSDDGVAINSYYTTYFFVTQQQEQALQLRSHRKLFSYLTGFVEGSGSLSITAYRDTTQDSVPLPSLNLINKNAPAAITGIQRKASILTVTCGAGHGMTAGVDACAVIAGANDATMNGVFPILKVVSATTFTVFQSLPDSVPAAAGTVTRLLRDFEFTTNILAERVAYKFGTNAVGAWFKTQKWIPVLGPDSWAPVRGGIG